MRLTKLALLMVGGITLASCTTSQSAAELTANGCGGYERGRLQGLRAGARINPPNANTEHGRKIIEETEFLAALCDAPA